MAEATKWDTIAPRQRSGKPPRPRDQRRLRNNFLIARPPLLAVMQGGESPIPIIHRPNPDATSRRRLFFKESHQRPEADGVSLRLFSRSRELANLTIVSNQY